MDYRLIAGRSSLELSGKISEYLQKELTPVVAKNHNDGETYFRIEESVRGTHAFVIQSTSYPANDNLMELLIMIDALKLASAEKITAIIPYFGYARQDRKVDQQRESITAKLVANMIMVAGVHRIITFDLHTNQIQACFNIPVDELSAIPAMAKYLLSKKMDNMVVVSPDAGGVKRAKSLAEKIFVNFGMMEKERTSHGKANILNLFIDVKDKIVILVDDMVDTAGTITEAVKVLKAKGAKRVIICATHGVLSKNAVELLNNSEVEEIVLTDSINIPKEKLSDKIKIVSVAPLLGEVIKCMVEGGSMHKTADRYHYNL
jgi:ribose-phosphate pyrophosphokinase